jgi:hypothetical protein
VQTAGDCNHLQLVQTHMWDMLLVMARMMHMDMVAALCHMIVLE